ncbi:MAG: hypothetical protein ACK4GJ_00395 [bacterium]
MTSLLEKIFLEKLLSLPLEIALKKIKLNHELEDKEYQIIFIDSINKQYFETNNGQNNDYLRVVGINLESNRIKIFVAYEIKELIEKKGKTNVEN